MSPQRAAALTFLALSAGYTFLAAHIEDAVRSPVTVLGPRGFPLLLGTAGIVGSLVLLVGPAVTGWLRSERAAPEAPARDTAVTRNRPGGVFAGDWRRTLTLCSLTLLYALALPRLGFTLSTTGFLAASFGLLGERRIAALYGVPLAIAVVLVLLLRGALGAHLPEPLFEAVLATLR